jgi:uncharacterized protein
LTALSYINRFLSLSTFQIENTLKLFSEGATIPFIARYRKEMTGELDEVQIADIQKYNQQFVDLEKRKAYILSSIDEKKLLTEDLKRAIVTCFDANSLEDYYLPYKSKKQSKADAARKKGLEPLAKMIMKAERGSPETLANRFAVGEIKSVTEAIEGAQHIIAEWVNENSSNRNYLRRAIQNQAVICSKLVKKKEAEAQKYKDYFDWKEKFSRMASHRFLAIMRGNKEGFIKVKLDFDNSAVFDGLNHRICGHKSAEFAKVITAAIKDSYKRLLFPSLENEALQLAKTRADKEAIAVFANNVQQLLMEAPLGQKHVMAIDPGFRTGCKVVCLNPEGNLLNNNTIYPHDNSKVESARKTVMELVQKYRIQAIAVGNGTAGRETESFIRSLNLDSEIQVLSVNESGASIYSASAVARAEFPNHDITVRGAVSIGRRLMDPLAELVKIEPKSIGVGQYQHDVDQKSLNESLDLVVSHCVNKVGVNINTASAELLTHVSGLGEGLAKNIVNFRKENGPFKNRKQLMNVPRLGGKAFEQCAGFLRISDGDNPLDKSAVHPERYALVKQMARDVDVSVNVFLESPEARKRTNANHYLGSEIGLPTIRDILVELDKPGRDPRDAFKGFEFSQNINDIGDLQEGMLLDGLVSNITSFGCFVDIGVHQDGLVHVSELANKFVSDPNEVVSLKQQVRVKVLSIDAQRKRIGLSIRQAQ